MAISFVAVSEPGRSLFGTAQQIQSNGTLGDHWDVATGQFSPSAGINARKVAMTEGGVDSLGVYTGGTGQLGTYTGYILKKIHDANNANRVIGVGLRWFVAGVEQRDAIANDVVGLPQAVQVELTTNPVPASNMRGTDLALLAADYTAPDNASITNAATDAATAATQATAAATSAASANVSASATDAKLTTARAANLDNLDASVAACSTHSAADVRTELNSNPVPASNMRGTDLALLAADYAGGTNNTTLTAIAADAADAKAAAELVEVRVTAARAGYLDNLSAGPVATSSAVSSITNSTRSKIVCAVEAQLPGSGSTTYAVEILLYDLAGNMEDADSTPTLTAANQSGTDRSANASTVTRIAAGHYRASYTVSSTHAEEQVVLTVAYTENALPLIVKHVMSVVGIVSGSGFTTADRSQLTAVFNKLPSKSYLTGTAAADGDINVDELDGDLSAIKADVTGLATAASVTAVPAAVQVELTSNPVPSSNMRGTDSALLAASYTAPNNTAIANAATDAALAATSSQAAETSSASTLTNVTTLVGRLTAARATNLDNLDAAVSTRSTFDASTTNVTITTTGLATATDMAAVKAKTDLLPASPAAVSDIPTASQVATQVEATLATAHGSGAWNTLSDATLANQLSIITALGTVVPNPPSPILVSMNRTWTIEHGTEDDRAPQIVTLSPGNLAVLAMDFGSALNPETGIATVATVTDLSGDTGTLTISDLAPSQDRMKAHFEVNGLEAGKRYDIKATVTTSDQQTLTGRGVLRVQ